MEAAPAGAAVCGGYPLGPVPTTSRRLFGCPAGYVPLVGVEVSEMTSPALFERVAEAIEAQHRRALREYAIAEFVWFWRGDAVIDSAASPVAGYSRHAA